MSNKELPISGHLSEDSIVALWRGRRITSRVFWGHIKSLVRQLPEKQFAINVCEDRYLFLVSFFAALIKGQTNLLPASKVQSLIEEMAADYNGSYILSDSETIRCDYLLTPADFGSEVNLAPEELNIKADHIAAVVFTSGSTGKSKPNIKSWGSLHAEALLAIERFSINSDSISAIVATVPPQHMYGLETSIIVPMLSGLAIVCAPTFYPADIESAINSVPGLSILITTPIHLKACVNSGVAWNNIKFVISATAMMPTELAKKVEQKLQTKLYEIYGASEYGSVATRRTVKESVWSLYDGMRLKLKYGLAYLEGPQFKNEIPVHDIIEIKDTMHFKLVGRDNDLIKIAGKRVSLADLNQKLWSIEGVVDGIFFAPQDGGRLNARLTAFIVAPGLNKDQVLNKLKQYIEPAFLPRPLIVVEELPRNASGKLPHKELQSLFDSLSVS